MKQQIGCLLDADENYVMLLSAYMNNSGLFKYKIDAFTKAEAIEDCSTNREVMFIVVSEELVDSVKNIESQVVIKLTENREDDGVFKYQEADSLIRDIKACLAETVISTSDNDYKSDYRIIGVYSPAGKTFKTSLALSLGLIFGQKQKTLYLNLEEFSGLTGILPDSRAGLSEALYYYVAKGKSGAAKILTMTRNEMGMDYLSPAICPDDIADTEASLFMDFVEEIASAGKYRTVILDVGSLIKYPVRILERCSTIYIPEPYDCMGKRKTQDFDGYLCASGREDLINKIIRIPVVYDKAYEGKEISLVGLKHGSMGVLAGRLANG